MYTPITAAYPSALPLEIQPTSLLPSSTGFTFHPKIYGGAMMLSEDKLITCSGLNDTASIQERPGATILSPIALSLAGITGQIVALFHLHRTSKKGPNKSVFYVLLATLIWTDLVGKVLTTPPAIISYAYGEWVGGMNLCYFHGFCMILIGLVTHFLVAAMAVDRFVCVQYCYFYKRNVTKSKARMFLLSIWLFCLVFSSLPLIGLGLIEFQYPGTWCFVNIHVRSDTLWYHRAYTNMFGLMNIFNIFIICVCNIMVIGILLTVRVSRHRKLSASKSHHQRSLTQRELEVQMSIVLLVITVVFLCSWCPLDARLFLNQIWPHTCVEDHISDLVAIRLASFNQIIDPWAYIICRRVFTSKLWKNCGRSVFIGRNFSSRWKKNSLNLNSNENVEAGMSSKGRYDSFTSSLKRKFSPSTSNYKGESRTNFECENETKGGPKSFRSIKGRIRFKKCRTTSEENRGSDKELQCVCRKNLGMDEESGKERDNEGTGTSPFNVFSRMQFRFPPRFHFMGKKRPKSSLYTKSIYSDTLAVLDDSVPDFSVKLNPDYCFSGRRHSWSCPPSVYKRFRTRSTQTLEKD